MVENRGSDREDLLDHDRRQHVSWPSACDQLPVLEQADMIGHGRSKVQIVQNRKHGAKRWSTYAFLEKEPLQVASLVSWFNKVRFFRSLPTEIMIVAEGDAAPRIPNVTPMPRDADHLSIAKPERPNESTCIPCRSRNSRRFEPT